VTRVLLMTILTIVIKKWIKNRFDILALSGMLTMLFGPSCVMNLGFCMSYLCTATIIYVYSLQIRNPIFEGLLVNLSATVVSLPFVLQMNQAISLWTVINSYAFSYLFIFVFIYLLITFWIVWIAPIQAFIVTVVFKIIQLSWSINVVIYWHQLPIYLIPLYYLGSYLSIRMLKFI
jgi:predicted membrane metal-binding protein